MQETLKHYALQVILVSIGIKSFRFSIRLTTDRFARGSLITEVTYLVIYTDIISIQSSNDLTAVPF